MARSTFLANAWTKLNDLRLVHDDFDSSQFMEFCRVLRGKSEAEISHALKRAENFTGFFTLPVFVELCEPDMQTLGLPEPEQAYHEACNVNFPAKAHRWSHAAVYHAGADVGWFDLRQNVNNPWNRFRQAYKVRCKEAADGVLAPIPRHEQLPEKPMARKLEGAELDTARSKLKQALGGKQ